MLIFWTKGFVNYKPLAEDFMPKTLQIRAARRLMASLTFIAVFLLFPAGSLHFWQAWFLLGLMAMFWTSFLINLLKHDPQLVRRRLEGREAEPEQKLFQKLFTLILLTGLIVAGLDFRFGWSRALGFVPLWLAVTGQAATVAGYSFVFWVMKANTFAGTIIQVESEQRVISSGPYAIVRHPMYLGMCVTALAMPVALGSSVALIVFALLVPVLIYRLIHEERILRRNLPGYAGYCEDTRFRLVPGVW